MVWHMVSAAEVMGRIGVLGMGMCSLFLIERGGCDGRRELG